MTFVFKLSILNLQYLVKVNWLFLEALYVIMYVSSFHKYLQPWSMMVYLVLLTATKHFLDPIK
jgi:hypothetical protein